MRFKMKYSLVNDDDLVSIPFNFRCNTVSDSHIGRRGREKSIPELKEFSDTSICPGGIITSSLFHPLLIVNVPIVSQRKAANSTFENIFHHSRVKGKQYFVRIHNDMTFSIAFDKKINRTCELLETDQVALVPNKFEFD